MYWFQPYQWLSFSLTFPHSDLFDFSVFNGTIIAPLTLFVVGEENTDGGGECWQRRAVFAAKRQKETVHWSAEETYQLPLHQ